MNEGDIRSRSTGWQHAWVQRFYRSKPGWVDGTTEFYELCRKYAPPNARVLEIGAGPTNPTSAFLATLGELHGLDVSNEVLGNRHLTRSAVIRDGRYPYDDSTFDLAVSNYVVEHVDDARAHLAEVFRVLRPGASYVFRTPNLFHYVALASRLTPHSVHTWLANRLMAQHEDAHEPWPTFYALNTPAQVRRHASTAGFELQSMDLVEKEPSYGMYARPLFLLFMAYERAVNASPKLAGLRANLFVVLHRPQRKVASTAAHEKGRWEAAKP